MMCPTSVSHSTPHDPPASSAWIGNIPPLEQAKRQEYVSKKQKGGGNHEKRDIPDENLSFIHLKSFILAV